MLRSKAELQKPDTRLAYSSRTRDYLRRELEELHEKIDALSPPKKPSAGKSDGGERRPKKSG